MDMLPSCVLQSIFAFADAPTLLTSVHLVSKTFHDAVRSEYLWLARLPTELAHALRSSGPGTSAGNGAALQLYLLLANSNLLSNPWQTLQQQTAERQAAIMPGRAKTPWVAMGDNSQTWKWGPAALEGLTTVPGAEPPMPPPPPPPLLSRGGAPLLFPCGAVASSWNGSMLMQEVDLVAALQLRGLTPAAARAFLDSAPALACEVWVAARFDSGGVWEVQVAVDSRPRPAPVDRAQHVSWMEGCAAVESSGQQRAEPQVWRRHQVLLESGYGPGARRAVVVLWGKSTQAWAGHYGAKFASPALRFVVPP